MITSNKNEKRHGLILNAGFQDSKKSVIKYAIGRGGGGEGETVRDGGKGRNLIL